MLPLLPEPERFGVHADDPSHFLFRETVIQAGFRNALAQCVFR